MINKPVSSDWDNCKLQELPQKISIQFLIFFLSKQSKILKYPVCVKDPGFCVKYPARRGDTFVAY